ncbi:hypothetical protein [Sphingomonas sp. ERG5]|uniref:hypothetical protein n=1 Tax=Sphingomonas sp. ERG5 TaxID=1381597 RepID=UPI00126A1F28|nr:hypothetical protein [Sphingomonas sp. ERG5]
MRKSVLLGGMIASSALSIASPALANPIASPVLGAPVNVTGAISTTVLGFLFNATCNVTMSGTVTSVGTATTPGVVTFTSGTATDIPGGAVCNDQTLGTVTFPIIARTTSQSVLTIDQLKLTTPLGTCTKNNVPVAWNNSTSGGTISTAAGICTSVTGTLQTVSSPIVIG